MRPAVIIFTVFILLLCIGSVNAEVQQTGSNNSAEIAATMTDSGSIYQFPFCAGNTP